MISTQDLVNYYANLLIQQYRSKPRAYAHIQTLATPALLPQVTTQQLTFSSIATLGSFVLDYNGLATASINYNDSQAAIQTKLQALSGLSAVTVSGSIASQSLSVNFNGIPPIAVLLQVQSNTLTNSLLQPVTVSVTETDVTLPIAILNAYNVTGSNTAQGVQLDIIGKYAGVIRTGYLPGSGFVTLSDSDFLTLIKLAITKNSLGSSLYQIANVLWNFFPNEIFVYDYQNMQMSYLISTSVGSLTLLNMVINQGLLPTPMGVQVAAIIYAPNVTKLFGYRTYQNNATKSVGFNSYANYQSGNGWLSYKNSIPV